MPRGTLSLRGPLPPSPTFCVATSGRDDQPGTPALPFATLHRAQSAVREYRRAHPHEPVTVMVRKGTYYLERTLAFTPEDSGSAEAPVVYTAWPGEQVTLSGGRRLFCRWQTRKGKSLCDLNSGNPGPFAFTQLFVNGKRQLRARFPSYDPASPEQDAYVKAMRTLQPGTSSPNPSDEAAAASQPGVIGIEFDPNTFSLSRWGNPSDAIIHIFQSDDLGMLDWRIHSIDYDRNRIWFGEGGGQLGETWAQSRSAVGPGSRFYVDNVLEEMRAPNQWYLAKQSGTLYYRADSNIDLAAAAIEVPVLDEVIRVLGERGRAVENISFAGFRFAHTETTYMHPCEAAPSGRWAFYRGAAVFLENTQNCAIRDCWFDSLGGNAVFWSGSNRGGSVTGCRISAAGENAICFAGRSGESPRPLDVSEDCSAVNNLIEACGAFGKQVAGLFISASRRITVEHNEFRDLPCAAVCIADGFGGGHRIESNRIRNAVCETKHYAPLTAWGNAPQTRAAESSEQKEPAQDPLDQASRADPIILRRNFIRHSGGPAILLDYDATNYRISNNVAAGAAIRIGSGGNREIFNNIWHNADTPVVFALERGGSGDRYHHNIAVLKQEAAYSLTLPSAPGGSIEEIDYNCIFRPGGTFSADVCAASAEKAFDPPEPRTWSEWRQLGFDRNSVWADPLLCDPAKEHFELQDQSPARKLGFEAFSVADAGPRSEVASVWKQS